MFMSSDIDQQERKKKKIHGKAIGATPMTFFSLSLSLSQHASSRLKLEPAANTNAKSNRNPGSVQTMEDCNENLGQSKITLMFFLDFWNSALLHLGIGHLFALE